MGSAVPYLVHKQPTFGKCLITKSIHSAFFNIFSSNYSILTSMQQRITSLLLGLAGALLLIQPAFSRQTQLIEAQGLLSVKALPLPESCKKDVKSAVRAGIDFSLISRIYEQEPEEILVRIPMPGGKSKDLHLFKTKVVSDDFKVTTSDGRQFQGKAFAGVHYQIRGNKNGDRFGVMSFTENTVMAVFSDVAGNWNVGILPDGDGDYVVYNERDLNQSLNFDCHSPDQEKESDLKMGKGFGWNHNRSVQSTGNCKTVRLYFECDFKMYTDNGSSTTNVSNRVAGMFNGVKQLYSNEQLDVELSQVFVWTSTDPYIALTTANSCLLNFATNRAAITENLGHFLTTRTSSLGGIAYIDVLCNPPVKFGFSNIYNTFSALPSYSWSIYCITHEIGHNFGSRHTHWCGWQLTASTIGRIDSCRAGETVTGAVNCANTTKPNFNGTMMSYCHVNGAVNFNRGFGNLPGAAIRNGFANATCISGNPIPQFSLGAPGLVCEGSDLNLKANTTTTGATFAWTGPNGFTSTAQNPTITGATAAAGGTYSCSLSKSGCTSDPKSISVVVNGINLPPLSEPFEGSFPPAGWRVGNPDNDRTFVQSTTVGGFGTSSKSAVFDNYNLPFIGGRRDTLFMPVLNLNGTTGTTLKFDVAHAWNTVTFDSLYVLVSTNCGRNFTRVYNKTGAALATAPNTYNAFIPTSTQWRTETVNLTTYNGANRLQVAFVNVAGGTNFLYLDNINLTTTGGASTPSITLSALTQSSFCPGANLSVAFTPTGTFNSGNGFSVQLSNSSGSFASPTVIGTGASSPISATIPSNAISGSGYLIRVVASNPAVVSGSSSAISISALVVNAGSDLAVCSDAAAFSLSGSPAGGTWIGTGVSTGGTFTPSSAITGNQTLTYTYSNAGCSGSDQVVVNVKALPAVNAGSNATVCSNASAFSLTGFSPAGGTWSGNGVSTSGLFTPSSALTGTQILTYTVSSNGCSNSDTRTITVTAPITVSAGLDQSVCSNGASLNLSGSPAGGTWSGPGVNTSGVFTPSGALVGIRTLTYSVSGTCPGSDEVEITVNAVPSVNAGIAQLFCRNDGLYPIIQGSPAGGDWSGTGVSGNTFDPNSANIGSNTLTYTVSQNGCTGSATTTFTVNAVPAPNAGLAVTVCENAAAFNLSGSPAGGTWSGNGVSGTGVFTPTAALVGSQTLFYNLTLNGCTGSASTTVTVQARPSVSSDPDFTTNVASSPSNLNGNPAGGTWSGTGVSASGVFNPAISGQGTFALTYTVTAGACTNSTQTSVTVFPAAVVSAGTNQNVCANASPISLSGVPAGGTWSGPGVDAAGTFTPTGLSGVQTLTYSVPGFGSDQVDIVVDEPIAVNAGSDQLICGTSPGFTLSGFSPAGGTWSGTGVNGAGVVNPSQISASGTTLTYTYISGGCTVSDEIILTVQNPPAVNAGTNSSICKNNAAIQLNGLPAGGTWSGPGVSSSGLFDPGAVPAGPANLTYTVDGSLPGCGASAQVTITVFSIPNINTGANRNTCSNSSPFNLTASPAGGSWTGPGVNGAGLFTPSSALIGIQTLTYTATQNGCSNSGTLQVTVNAVPSVNAGADFSLCTNTSSFTMQGASPAGGTWSGAGFVSGAGGINGPLSSGNYNLTYTVSENGCVGTDQVVLTVNSTPTVNAGTNRSVCANGNSLTLSGFSPAGGIWSGNGVSGSGVFSPSASLVGNQTLTYTVTQNGCQGSGQIVVNVKAIPNIITGSDETVCASGQAFKVNGYSPRGGKWTGPGIVQDSIFTPAAVLIGSQTITYSITQNGCTASRQKTIQVFPGTTITAGSVPTSICSNSAPVTFTGFSPSNGVWKGPGITAGGTFTPGLPLLGTQTWIYRVDQNGCRDSISVQAQVIAAPVVNAGPDLSACASGAPVSLSSGTPAGGTWSGNGISNGQFFPTQVSPGLVNLSYSVTLNGCTSSDGMVMNVSSAPSVSAGNDRNICRNSIPVQLAGNPVGGTWSGTGVSPEGLFTPTTSMSGNITLTYTINDNGCVGSDQVVLSITSPVTVNAGPAQQVCDNAPTFNLSGFSPAGGVWSGPGVSPTGSFNPDPTLVGAVTLTYRVTQGSCVVEASKSITVNASPNVSAGPDISLCSNAGPQSMADFFPTGGTWSGPGVNAQGTFTPTNTGQVNLTYTFTQNGCPASDTRLVTVIPAPVVNAGPQQSVCGAGNAILMSGFFPEGGTWSGAGMEPNGTFTSEASMAGNTITVSYSVSQNGCTASSNKSIAVVNIPSSLSVSSSSSSSCEGSLITLSANTSGLSNFLIQWMKNGLDIPGANANQYQASSSGDYAARLQVSSCVVESDSQTLAFTPVPQSPQITLVGTTLNAIPGGANTQWLLNGSALPGATGPSFTPTQSGIYSAIQIGTLCNSEASNTIPVQVTSKLSDVLQNVEYLLYPHPGLGQIHLKIKNAEPGNYQLQLLDASGRSIWAETQTCDSSELWEPGLSQSPLAPGMYWIRISGNQIQKVLKAMVR